MPVAPSEHTGFFVRHELRISLHFAPFVRDLYAAVTSNERGPSVYKSVVNSPGGYVSATYRLYAYFIVAAENYTRGS